MKFLKRKTTWTNGEIGIIKSAMICLGIVLGLYFYNYLNDLISLFFILFIVTGIFSTLLYVGKRQKNKYL